MPKIVVVGSFVVGITFGVPRAPVLGETLMGDSFDLGTAARVPSVWQEMNALLGALETPRRTSSPRLEAVTTDDALTLSLLAPGVRAEDVDVQVTGRRLEVSVLREPQVPEGFRTVRHERRAWRLDRTFELPFDVLPEHAKATLEAGVFTLVLPRTPEPKPVKISVQADAGLITTEEV